MEAQSITLQLFDLHHTKLVLNHSQPIQKLLLQGQLPYNPAQVKSPPNLIDISFSLIINEPLNECLKPRARLAEIWFKSLKIEVNLVTKPGEFCFEEMNYYMFLEVKAGKTDSIAIRIENVEEEYRRTKVDVRLNVHREGSTIAEAEMNTQLSLFAGKSNAEKMLKFQLQNFKVKVIHQSEINKLQQNKPNKFTFKDGQYSLPLGVFKHSQEIYRAMSDKNTLNTLEDFQQLIQGIPAYQAEPRPVENKLYICHDMKGGYREDLFFDHNIVPNQLIENQAYRSLHLEQSEIFNYFSHHNITVPPKHWRLLCKKYHTQCLGTFITERQDYSQNMLVSKQFALFLVAIAKKCHFDGFLINIERNVGAITAFKQWLQFFTLKMHQFIPNSTVIWYDSISAKDGVIRYQNGLSRQNYEMYHHSDGLFTNYWWDQNKLRESVEFKKDNKRKVFIGNDCFGRNTYGGGKMDIYIAANKILEYKDMLSIGLFAPGYTYEASDARSLYHMHQNGLYKGIKPQRIDLNEWKESKKKRDSGGWEKQDIWAVSSFGRCQRSTKLKFKPLDPGQQVRIVFYCHVASTPPCFGSHYKIILQIVDDDTNNVVSETDVYNFFNAKLTTEKTQLISEFIDLDAESLANKNLSVKIIIMAKCSQHWQGYFGPRFATQMVFILTYDKQKNWIGRMPISQVPLNHNYHSYCNMGFGQNFYHQGEPLQKFYNYLADMDIPHTYTINHPFDTAINYENAFLGGSSLEIKKETIKLLKVFIPSSTDLSKEYFLVVTVKGTLGVNATFKYISKNEEDRAFTAKLMGTQEVGEWKRFTFKLVTSLKALKNDVRSIVQLKSIKFPYYLGQIKTVRGKKETDHIKCQLEPSREVVPTNSYFLHLTIQSNFYKRLYVRIQKLGMFTYFEEGVARLQNFPVEKCQSLEIQVIDTDECLEDCTLRYKVLDSANICELIFKGQLSF